MERKKLKPLDFKILSELMKNAKSSDRQIAKKLGVSQPTVTRRRANLEKKVIEGYTAIPRWKELGYEILAVTFVKTPLKFASDPNMKEALAKSMKWLQEQPNVIFGGGCRGFGMTGVMFSVHKNYAALDEFLTKHRQQLGPILEGVETAVVNLAGEAIYRPLNLTYLANHIQST